MPRCRRHFALGIRGLMLLVLIVGGGIGWEARRAARQAWAVSVIERAGGQVYYGDELDDEGEGVYIAIGMCIVQRPEPWTPAWLRRVVGDDALRVVRRIDLPGHSGLEGDDNISEFEGRVVAAIGALDGLYRVDAWGVPCQAETMERLTDLPRLRSLSLTINSASPFDLSRLSRLPALNNLIIDLGDTPPGVILDQIAGLSRLKDLSLYGIPLAEPGDLNSLNRLTGLERLTLVGLPATGPWLDPIRDLVHLKRLEIEGYCPGDDDLANLERLVELEELVVDDEVGGGLLNGLGDDGLFHLRNLKSLKTLRVDGSEITDAGLDHLRGLKSLSVLWVIGQPIGDAGLQAISALTALEELCLETSVPLNDATLDRLAGLKSLKDLSMYGPGVTDTGLDALAKLSALETLSLHGSSVGGSGLAHLVALPKLTRLDLSESRLDDTGAEQIKGLAGLNNLNLSHTAITDAALRHLARLPALEFLGLEGTTITDAGLMALRDLSTLRYLNIKGTSVTAGGIATFREARPEVRLYR